jgi:hypothetical protein
MANPLISLRLTPALLRKLDMLVTAESERREEALERGDLIREMIEARYRQAIVQESRTIEERR